MNTAATLVMIKRRFAGSDRAVERAFEASESFRGLCTDYLACATALARWQDSREPQTRSRVEEYSALLAELTNEIRERLRTEERIMKHHHSDGGT